MKGIYKAFQCFDGRKVIYLLSHSQRIKEDLTSISPLIQYGLRTSIVIRKWNSELIENPSMEFRAFVYKNNLNAVTQYDYMSYYPLLDKRNIESRIVTFWKDHVCEKLMDFESYIIDLFVGENEVKIIELNSFEAWTGGCLFSWNSDLKILMHGPLEFRFAMNQIEDIFLLIPHEWRDLIQKNFPDVFKEKDAPLTVKKSYCFIS